MTKAEVSAALNGVLADATVLYEKLHGFHWYVQGRQFFALHAQFEAIYDKWNGWLDDVAERILVIGGKPVATLTAAVQQAKIKEYDGTTDANTMVTTLLADYDHVLKSTAEVLAKAEAAGDRGTANMLDGIRDDVEKQCWMLRAWLAE